LVFIPLGDKLKDTGLQEKDKKMNPIYREYYKFPDNTPEGRFLNFYYSEPLSYCLYFFILIYALISLLIWIIKKIIKTIKNHFKKEEK